MAGRSVGFVLTCGLGSDETIIKKLLVSSVWASVHHVSMYIGVSTLEAPWIIQALLHEAEVCTLVHFAVDVGTVQHTACAACCTCAHLVLLPQALVSARQGFQLLPLLLIQLAVLFGDGQGPAPKSLQAQGKVYT